LYYRVNRLTSSVHLTYPTEDTYHLLQDVSITESGSIFHQHQVSLPNGNVRYDEIACLKEAQKSSTCPLKDKIPKDDYYKAPKGTSWKEKCLFRWRDTNPEAAEQEKLKREAIWRAERDLKNKEGRKKSLEGKSDYCID
jgi:hypothetical protein